MDSVLLISTAATVTTLVAGIIAAAAIAFTTCYMLTKKFKVTRVFADRLSEAKNPLIKRTKKKNKKAEATAGGDIDRSGNMSFSGNNGEFQKYCRVGLISDLHFPMIAVNLADVIYQLRKEDCDLIAVTGDLCQNEKGREKMLEFMTGLADAIPDVPILVVLGNHDVTHVCGKNMDKLSKYATAVEQCGRNIKVLRDETLRIDLKGSDSSVVVAGFEEFIAGNPEKRKNVFEKAVLEAGENDKLLLLMHNPDIMEGLRDNITSCGKYSVALAGHTHGGQVYVPFNFEFRVLRDDRMPRKGFVYGLYEYCENNRLYITCGLGQSFLPIRLGTTPEIAFICF